jgi:Eukaryotic glutathione synthase, ATP binding domain
MDVADSMFAAGNNVFGEAIRTELLRIKDSPERSSYILMKRINPLVVRNYAVAWRQKTELREMVSEIGIYGTLIA